MCEICNLNNIVATDYYIVNKINASELIKRRLYDVGIVNGTKIKRLFTSPSKKIKAYLVKDSIIAIRNKDAQLVSVSKLND